MASATIDSLFPHLCGGVLLLALCDPDHRALCALGIAFGALWEGGQLVANSLGLHGGCVDLRDLVYTAAGTLLAPRLLGKKKGGAG